MTPEIYVTRTKRRVTATVTGVKGVATKTQH